MASREEQSRRVPCTRLAVAAAVSAAVIDTSGKQKIAGNTPATTACALGHGLIKFARPQSSAFAKPPSAKATACHGYSLTSRQLRSSSPAAAGKLSRRGYSFWQTMPAATENRSEQRHEKVLSSI